MDLALRPRPKMDTRRKRCTEVTSNDIIAGNGRIISVHEYCVVIFV